MIIARQPILIAVVVAIGAMLVAFLTPKPAHAQSAGIYTTTSTTTSTSSTDSAGVTTTNSTTTNNRPRDFYSTDDRDSFDRDFFRDRDRNFDYWNERTSDGEARYPYDNTDGRNRSDVDAARSGFDDPRNPWDGRYMNDNPANSPVAVDGNGGSLGSNATVNGMRGNENYRPGSYGTTRIGR